MSQQKQLSSGVVKQVLSGDTLIIRGAVKSGPPPEKTICLSNIAAPKLARKAPNVSEVPDSPYAWESREYLRKLTLGQAVKFSTETETSTGRIYGTVYCKIANNVVNVAESIVQNGFATVRKESAKSQPELLELEAKAKSQKLGLHAGNNEEHIRKISWSMENTKEFFKANKEKPLKAIIEHIRDGSTYRGFFLPNFQHFTIMLSGAKSPAFKLDSDNRVDMANSEEFCEEAKFFIETRLLQREVEITLEDFTNSALIGSVKHPMGDVAELLLRQGYARCHHRHIFFVAGGPAVLRAAEKDARLARRKIWKSYQPPKENLNQREFVGTVVDVPYGDSLVVMTGGTEMVVHLNNIRAPRPLEDTKKPAGARKGRNLYDIPLMFEAREFLREMLMGKKVEVTLEHKVDTTNENKVQIKRNYCMVKLGDINVAEKLLDAGLGTLAKTRENTEGRTACYDDLIVAEHYAKEESKGVHGKDLQPMRVLELTGDKSKNHLPTLKRQGLVDALVEHVTSGSRFKCFIAKSDTILTFLLSGINCPRNDKESPLGVEAHKFTKSLIHLRKVQLEFESTDKKGNFVGTVHINGKNLAVRLLEEGMASLHFSADSSKHYNAMKSAETKAKDKKLRMWLNVDTEATKENNSPDTPKVRKVSYKSVRVSDVCQNGHMFVQYCSDGPSLEKMMEELGQTFSKQPPTSGGFAPTRGQLCAAKFTDGCWYRALVEKMSKKEVHVLYVDYGNREVTTAAKLAPLPASVSSKPRYAHEIALAFIKFPEDEEYLADALSELMSVVTDKELSINYEYRADGVDYCTMKTKDDVDIAHFLIKNGFVLAAKSRDKRFADIMQEYQDAQSDAKKSHRNLWEYGDITDDDAFEFGMQR